ncbi:OmpA family protein [Vitreimonas flagellata]|uniref:OmpA family protein n=1 Tax=Vitreimonas flagellata TaxID=2560861 RepID=UPI001074E6B9|nr:outer membrane beta-barrel protein [Vitreimonas flagellata]
MKSRITKTVAIAAVMAGASGAAHATEGWYGRADVGYSLESTVDGNVDGEDFSGDLENDWMGALGLGYAFDNGFRTEGELAYRYNDWEGEIDGGDAAGYARSWSAMANLFYDFNRGASVEPYLGIGVGAARIGGGIDGIGSDQDTVLAYQALAGIAFGITEQLDLDVGYRYFVAPDVEFEAAGLPIDVDYEHQAVTVGLRYQFAAPAAAPVVTPPVVTPPVVTPPVVATPACPTSEFVVYFEWDRSNLNQAALETIDAAVNRARQCNVSGVVVVGHTDTSGSPTYNQGLSERRASVVRDALVARGIAAGSVTSQARGESDLARATRDGVREPLNRRTAVTISFR